MSLNDLTYSELAVLAGRLSMMAKRPISLGMTITLTTIIFEKLLTIPALEEQWKKMFSKISPTMLTPQEFDKHWDELYEVITGEKKK